MGRSESRTQRQWRLPRGDGRAHSVRSVGADTAFVPGGRCCASVTPVRPSPGDRRTRRPARLRRWPGGDTGKPRRVRPGARPVRRGGVLARVRAAKHGLRIRNVARRARRAGRLGRRMVPRGTRRLPPLPLPAPPRARLGRRGGRDPRDAGRTVAGVRRAGEPSERRALRGRLPVHRNGADNRTPRRGFRTWPAGSGGSPGRPA